MQDKVLIIEYGIADYNLKSLNCFVVNGKVSGVQFWCQLRIYQARVDANRY